MIAFYYVTKQMPVSLLILFQSNYWLLSPQYGKNEELFEIRYLWRRNQRLAVAIRGRWRKDLEPVFSTAKREDFDFYLRLTWGFSDREL